MTAFLAAWLHRLLPPATSVSQRERFRSGAGALVGVVLTGVLSAELDRSAGGSAWLMAPMGASAVLLFAVPSSPLAQPWPVVGGNVVAALIGVTCARWIAYPLTAAAAAIFLSIGAMFAMRCLHPPSGAVALTAVLGGTDVHAAGYAFVLTPVALNTLLMLFTAVAFNTLIGRRYPHGQRATEPHPHDTRDALPTARLGFTSQDLLGAMKEFNQVLDISFDDLEDLLHRTERQLFTRRFGQTRCDAVMSRDVLTAEFATELADAWRLMQQHDVQVLPVVDRTRRVIGIVSRSDFLRHADLSEYQHVGKRVLAFLSRTPHTHSTKHEVVGQIMSKPARTVVDTSPIVELVPLMSDIGHHHVPVVDADHRLVGIVTQSDVIAALYEICLGQLPGARPDDAGEHRINRS